MTHSVLRAAKTTALATRSPASIAALALACTLSAASAAHAEIYVSNFDAGTVGVYRNDGTPINTALISGVVGASGLAISGDTIYVSSHSLGYVGAYHLDGSVINTHLIVGLTNPNGITIDNGHLYVADVGSGKVGEYDLFGGDLAPNLITGLKRPTAVAIANSAIFVAELGNGNLTAGYISTFDIFGDPAGSIITGIFPHDLLVYPSSLTLTDGNSGNVRSYSAAGYSTLISSLVVPAGLATLDGNLFVVDNYTNTVGEFDSAGNPINSSLITGLGGPERIVVTPQSLPEPTSLALLGTAGVTTLRRRRR